MLKPRERWWFLDYARYTFYAAGVLREYAAHAAHREEMGSGSCPQLALVYMAPNCPKALLALFLGGTTAVAY